MRGDRDDYRVPKNRTKWKRHILFVSSMREKTYGPYIKLMVLWVSIVPAVEVFCGSCHCLSKTSDPHLVLFSRKLNQLFPQQPCCFKQELKTSVPIRKVCCNGDVSFMRICILLRSRGNNFCCVFLFQVVLCLYSLSHFLINFLLIYSNSLINYCPRKSCFWRPNINFFWVA